MKKINNLTSQQILLEGFGFIEISEDVCGRWKLDLFPRGSENHEEELILETRMESHGDKYFAPVKDIRAALQSLEGY